MTDDTSTSTDTPDEPGPFTPTPPAPNPNDERDIHSRISAIIGEVAEIEKDERYGDPLHGESYLFRTVESIKSNLKPLLAAHGVHYTADKIKVVADETLGSVNRHRVVVQITWLLHRSGDPVEQVERDGLTVSYAPTAVRHVTIGEAIDTSDKAFAKAMTQAEKYMLIQAFAICDGEGEGDRQRPSRSDDGGDVTVDIPNPNSVGGTGEGAWTVNSMKNAALRMTKIAVRRERPDVTEDQISAFVAAQWTEMKADNLAPSADNAQTIGRLISTNALRTADEWVGIDIHADVEAEADTEPEPETPVDEEPDAEPEAGEPDGDDESE